MEIRDFLFLELEDKQAESTAVEVLRAGKFVDRNGRVVAVTRRDLDVYMVNFAAGVAGQEIPVDVVHERREAAGWLRRMWRDEDVLLATVD